MLMIYIVKKSTLNFFSSRCDLSHLTSHTHSSNQPEFCYTEIFLLIRFSLKIEFVLIRKLANLKSANIRSFAFFDVSLILIMFRWDTCFAREVSLPYLERNFSYSETLLYQLVGHVSQSILEILQYSKTFMKIVGETSEVSLFYFFPSWTLILSEPKSLQQTKLQGECLDNI